MPFVPQEILDRIAYFTADAVMAVALRSWMVYVQLMRNRAHYCLVSATDVLKDELIEECEFVGVVANTDEIASPGLCAYILEQDVQQFERIPTDGLRFRFQRGRATESIENTMVDFTIWRVFYRLWLLGGIEHLGEDKVLYFHKKPGSLVNLEPGH
ncbi:hypothetical protein BC832DRAFT_563764 [Gaertneriomyces semiglobifer]|nr:hypothetical protein BC832DRAFT_563764 [Gaertneriomyces semiglobifer]